MCRIYIALFVFVVSQNAAEETTPHSTATPLLTTSSTLALNETLLHKCLSMEGFKGTKFSNLNAMEQGQVLGCMNREHQAVEDKLLEVGDKLLEVGVIRFLRVSLSGFIEKYCNSNYNVRKEVKGIKRRQAPKDTELPEEIQRQQAGAKGTALEEKVETYIDTFRYVYAQVRAILKYADSTDKGMIAFKAMFDIKGLSVENADDKIAKACAFLNYLLSEKVHLDDVTKQIRWTDWDAVEAALTECGIVNTQVIEAAKSIHNFKLVILN